VRKLVVALVILAVLAAGALFWAYYSLDVIVKVALEHFGPQVTGTSVKVADIKLSPSTGKGSLHGIEIGNPPGYSTQRAVKLGEMRVSLDPATVRSDVIVIRELAVDAPVIVYERGPKTTNLDAIQANIERYVKASGAASDGSASPPGDKRRFIIERISIRNVKVTMTNPGLKGQGITFDLPDIELRDLGKRQNGISASQAANIVATTLVARIAQKVLTNFQLLRKGGVEGAVDALKGLIK